MKRPHARKTTKRCSAIAQAEDRLLQLGGLGLDDSMRAHAVAMGMKAFGDLISGNLQIDGVSGEELGALARLLADDAERVAERQMLDEARRTGR